MHPPGVHVMHPPGVHVMHPPGVHVMHPPGVHVMHPVDERSATAGYTVSFLRSASSCRCFSASRSTTAGAADGIFFGRGIGTLRGSGGGAVERTAAGAGTGELTRRAGRLAGSFNVSA